MGFGGGDAGHNEKRLPALVLDDLKSRKFLRLVRNEATEWMP